MSKVFKKVLGVVLGTPTTIAMAGASLGLGVLGVMACVPILLGLKLFLFGPGAGVDPSGGELVSVIFGGAILVAMSFLFFWLSWVAGRMTLDMGAGVAGGARGVVKATRAARAARAARAERLEEQGGQISLSVDAGTGGGLTQATSGSSGLELVDEDVTFGAFEKEEDEVVPFAEQQVSP